MTEIEKTKPDHSLVVLGAFAPAKTRGGRLSPVLVVSD